jgi:hypothetical protein
MVVYANTNCCTHLSCSSWEDTTFQGTCHQRQVNGVLGNLVRMHDNEGLVLDILRGRGRSIGGDLDIGEEGSKQTIVTLQSLYYGSDGYRHTRKVNLFCLGDKV